MADVAVMGAGAAGMICAATAAQRGATVTLFEKNEKPGKKIYITGKGRCNLTNECDPEEFISNVVSNSKFLYSAIYSFDSYALEDYFKSLGLKIKTERGNRVFPLSDKASDVTKALERELKRLDVDIRYNTRITAVNTDGTSGAVTGVTYVDESRNEHKEDFSAVVIASGGLSYPSTGSTGDGLKIAKDLGHTVVDTIPSLVPLRIADTELFALKGLSLRNVSLCIKKGKKTLYDGFGEMLFTHKGISGPLVLSASSICGREISKENELSAYIDLKPALSMEKLDERILRDFEGEKNRDFSNAISALLPSGLIPFIIKKTGINPKKKVHDITREERMRLAGFIKAFPLTVTGLYDYNEAVVTKGGIRVSEVDPSTMESKLVKRLFFAGEVLDVDALTGGFNLQIAWSTGRLAGLSI